MDAQKQREKCPGRGLAEEGTSLPVAFPGGMSTEECATAPREGY